jgi:hypothetical protein
MDSPTIGRIERVLDPEDPKYRKYIDVALSNGMKVRHAIGGTGQYVKLTFGPKGNTIEKRVVADSEDMSQHLEDTVQVWLSDIETNRTVPPSEEKREGRA